MHDVSEQNTYRAVLIDMKARLVKQQKQLKDTLDLSDIL